MGVQVLHVDGARGDTYTADGTLARPYKTIQAAITAATPGAGYIHIHVAKGVYTENLTMKDHVYVTGTPTRDWQCKIIGTVTFPVGITDWSTLSFFRVDSTADPTISIVGAAGLYYCSVRSTTGVAILIDGGAGWTEIACDIQPIRGATHGIHIKGSANVEFAGTIDVAGGGGANKDVKIEAGSMLSVIGILECGNSIIEEAGSLFVSHSPSEREQEFTASGGDQTFTLDNPASPNPNLPSGYAILGVFRNGVRLRYQASPTTNAHYGFTFPTSIVCKNLTTSDIIAVQFGGRVW